MAIKAKMAKFLAVFGPYFGQYLILFLSLKTFLIGLSLGYPKSPRSLL
jgi:hypothetical protein